MGFFNAKSKIQVRVIARERVTVDQTFFEQRIREALTVRQRWMPNATSLRVVNAESDGLSGLIVDKYEDVLVVQMSALGMDRRKAMIVAALRSALSPRAILERGEMASRTRRWGPSASTKRRSRWKMARMRSRSGWSLCSAAT